MARIVPRGLQRPTGADSRPPQLLDYNSRTGGLLRSLRPFSSLTAAAEATTIVDPEEVMKDAIQPHPAWSSESSPWRAACAPSSGRRAAELLEVAAAMSPLAPPCARGEPDARRGGIEDFDASSSGATRGLPRPRMAHILENQGDFSRTLEMIDLAKLRTPFNYLAYAAAGYLYLRHETPPRPCRSSSRPAA